MIKRILIVTVSFICALFTLQVNGQGTSKEFYEELIINPEFQDRAPIALPFVNKDDTKLYSKIIWREIMLTEKMNLPLYYPTEPMDGRMSLIDVLMNGIEKNFKTAYEDDELKIPITMDDIKKKFDVETTTLERLNNETGEMEVYTIDGTINTSEVKRIHVKEIWYFNQRTSRMECRIIAICPVREFTKPDVDEILKSRLFWIDYGEFRDIFAKQKVFNPENDGNRLSLDDIFLKRYFSSRIYKASNVYNNREISSFSVGIDGILESERIKNEIFQKEQDLWVY